MPIQNVTVNVTDVSRSVDFYTKYLGAEPIGSPTGDRALLDLVTATLELRGTESRIPSSWVPDDLQRGFRHIGFKVDAVDPRAEVLKAGDIPFHLDPLDAEGGVRICFFFDPDGTLLEFVEGDLQYATVLDEDGVRRERALGVPGRPRFDHIALTVMDRDATEAFYADRFGFRLIGTIEQPKDPRRFRIGYLKSGDTVLEIFTFDVGTRQAPVRLGAPGFSHASLGSGSIGTTGSTDGLMRVGTVGADAVFTDEDGFRFSAASVTAGSAT